MSTTAALLEGHYFMSLSGMGERWARCQCGAELEWNDAYKEHARHLLDVVRADHEKDVRERIAQDIRDVAAKSHVMLHTNEYPVQAVPKAELLDLAARIAREGVAP